ncbi:MAG: nucleoside deaminase [Candidatus Stahlbacteria bacterium]|nr:nucleoside deaminase [Candidatus Stahlbacteria bacterium]
MDDNYWMREALKMARIAYENNEIPVGAVVVMDNRIIGRGFNQVEELQDPTAHSEIIAITSACRTIGNWRLNGTAIYVILEPCPMCAGAILNSRIAKCVFGTKDTKLGALGSVYDIRDTKIEIVSGILESECKSIIDEFFKIIRDENRKEKDEEKK